MFYVFKIELGQKEKNVQGINKIQLKLENSPPPALKLITWVCRNQHN